jgi:hypothetical protein
MFLIWLYSRSLEPVPQIGVVKLILLCSALASLAIPSIILGFFGYVYVRRPLDRVAGNRGSADLILGDQVILKNQSITIFLVTNDEIEIQGSTLVVFRTGKTFWCCRTADFEPDHS